ncbi:MAG: glycosyltransferase [candidate division KSB1 bacterium]|nr:glycosyltransferase [candidate division KSB1 bacterium]
MRVLYIAGREEGYSRTRNVLKALRMNGVEVIPCFPPDRSFRHYPGLLWRVLRNRQRYDLVLVGFYGQLLLPWVRLLAKGPILYDMYITTYDTMVFDRGVAAPGTLRAWLFGLADRLSMRLADMVVLESQDHIDSCVRRFKIPPQRFRRVFLATDEEVIRPRAVEKEQDEFLVHFHGEYAPFHGVKYILLAAHLLRGEGVTFQIIGRGITYEADRRLAEELGLRNVRFLDNVPFEELATYMSRADVCLGIFGDNERVSRVVTNKVIEAIAVGKPLISSRNAPIQELLVDGESVLLCERANPESLAQAILRLKRDPGLRHKIAQGGHKVFLEHCTCHLLGKQLKAIASELVHDRSAN